MLKEEIASYTQRDGLISPNKNPGIDSTGNGLLYTSLYYILLHKTGQLTCDDRHRFRNIVLSCRAHGSRFYGLLHRSPTKIEEQTGHDDYVGVCTALMLLDLNNIAWLIVNFGNKRNLLIFKWLYNNLCPIEFTFQAWRGRRPEVVAHMQQCVDTIKVHPLRVLYMAIYILIGGVDGHHQSIIMRYLIGSYSKYRIVRWAWSKFEKRILKKYNRGMADVLAKELGALHPVVRYWV